MQAAVDRDDLAGGFAEAFGDEQEVSFRLVGRGDRALGESAVSIELSEFVDQGFGRFILREGDVVFGEGTDDAIAREHGGA